MPTFTVCRVVRTSALLGPERMAQALKIILTLSTQKEASHGSSAGMPASRRANRRKRIPSRVKWRRSTRTLPRTTTPCCLNISFLTMGSVGVVETVLPSIVCETRPA